MSLVVALLQASTSRLDPAEIWLAIGQARPGNIFEPGEPIVVPVTTTADELLWLLTDFDGIEVASGRSATGPSPARLVLEPPGAGYFELELRDAAGGGQPVRTSLVVLPSPPPVAGRSPFGVMTHFAQGWDVDLIPLITRAGIRHVRDEQYWSQVERERGRYLFPERLTRYMDELAGHNLKPLIVLSFSNDLYDEGSTPFTDAGRAGYARYGRAVLDHYGSQIEAVEIWNEYNGPFCKGPCRDDRPAYYTRMLEQAYHTIASSRPDVTVAGGAAVTIPLPYLEAVFEAGGLGYMDALVVHPYGSEPVDVTRQIRDLKALMERHGQGQMPVWATEFGQGKASWEGRREAARYLVRMASALLAAGVERIYWYLLRDDREFNGMGLLRAADSAYGRYAPAPAYAAYAQLIHTLEGARFVRQETIDQRVQIHLFERAGRQVRVAWPGEFGLKLRLEAEEGLSVVDLVGRRTAVLHQGDSGTLVLGADPVYIIGDVRQLAVAGREELLADSVGDYAHEQGAGGWYYGYYEAGRNGEAGGPGAYDPDDFQLMEPVSTQWSRQWGRQQYPWLALGPRSAHPSRMADRPVWAIRRWISDTSDRVRITGRVSNPTGKGDGVTAQVMVDGRLTLMGKVGGPGGPEQLDYDLTTVLQAGSLVDFVLTAGADADIDFDSSTFVARITRDRPHDAFHSAASRRSGPRKGGHHEQTLARGWRSSRPRTPLAGRNAR